MPHGVLYGPMDDPVAALEWWSYRDGETRLEPSVL